MNKLFVSIMSLGVLHATIMVAGEVMTQPQVKEIAVVPNSTLGSNQSNANPNCATPACPCKKTLAQSRKTALLRQERGGLSGTRIGRGPEGTLVRRSSTPLPLANVNNE